MNPRNKFGGQCGCVWVFFVVFVQGWVGGMLNRPRSWQTDFLIYFGNLKVIFSLEEGWRGFIQVVFRTVPHLYYLVSELDFIAVWQSAESATEGDSGSIPVSGLLNFTNQCYLVILLLSRKKDLDELVPGSVQEMVDVHHLQTVCSDHYLHVPIVLTLTNRPLDKSCVIFSGSFANFNPQTIDFFYCTCQVHGYQEQNRIEHRVYLELSVYSFLSHTKYSVTSKHMQEDRLKYYNTTISLQRGSH